MNGFFSLPFSILRGEPRLVARFFVGTLGRAALTACTILLIHQFLATVLGQPGGWASALLERFGLEISLWTVIALLALVQFGAVAMTYDSRLSEHRILTLVELRTLDRVIARVLGLSVDFFDDRTHGDFVQSVRHDVANLRIVTASTATLLLETTQAIGLIAVSVSLSPSLAVWAFFLIPVAVIPVAIAARRTLVGSERLRGRNVRVFDLLLQLLHGIRIIKTYETAEYETRRTGERVRQYFDDLEGIERTRALARVAIDSLSGINMIVVAVVGGLQVMGGTLGWAELLAFFLAARAVQGPLNNLNTAWMEVRRHGASVLALETLLRTEPTVRDPDAPCAAPETPRVLTVEGVTFARGGHAILERVSFSIRSGETLGIVGPSGSGKTTLLNLVARFYDPTAGRITMDGIDLRELRLADVHGRMAIVTQDPFLFSGTIEENIARGRFGATRAEIESAARAAEIHEDIAAMPDGYDTLVGPGARVLSRGEAQRINIARAMLKNAPILLLDEATSSLDSWSEARVQRALDHLVEGRMVLSVAHRLSTLRNAARILVIDGGRVAGLGTHEELLTTCETYVRLWDAQSHRGNPDEGRRASDLR